MVRKVYRVTECGFYIGTYSTLGKAMKATTHKNKSGWHTHTPREDVERIWETYKHTGFEIQEIIVR